MIHKKTKIVTILIFSFIFIFNISLCLAAHGHDEAHEKEINSHHSTTGSIEALEDIYESGGEGISFDQISPEKSVRSSLPIWLIIIPLLGGIFLAFLHDDRQGANLLILFRKKVLD